MLPLHWFFVQKMLQLVDARAKSSSVLQVLYGHCVLKTCHHAIDSASEDAQDWAACDKSATLFPVTQSVVSECIDL
jgi:hypothetical protein